MSIVTIDVVDLEELKSELVAYPEVLISSVENHGWSLAVTLEGSYEDLLNFLHKVYFVGMDEECAAQYLDEISD